VATTATTANTRSGAWAGWIGFAGWMMVIVGALDFFEGLIAVIRDQYYVLGANQIIVFDVTTWGWVTLIWGIVLAFAGYGILTGASWARWFAIIAGSLNFIVQLGFAGSSSYPLWALTIQALMVLVLYALIVHWDDTVTFD
jgi:predicted membrane metal-binding protein